MKNYPKLIAKEWNAPIREAQVQNNEHAPVECHVVPTSLHRDAETRMFKLMQEELYEYKEASEMSLEEHSAEEILIAKIDAIFDMKYILDGIIAQHGLQNFQELFMDEIHNSNLTKIQNGKILLREDGKVLKPKTFKSPNLKLSLRIAKGEIEN
jgi:predicted HAD superfamily Cof-like phosphohydrolase